MNLATEYLIRTGAAQNNLRLPCAIFVSHYLTYEKVVVTVDPSDKFFKVRRWYLTKAKSTEDMPPHEETTLIDRESLFESDFSIVPEYKILPYQEVRYKQRNIDPTDVRREAEYHNLHIKFGNNQLHQNYRRQWLWDAFQRVHGRLVEAFTDRWHKWVDFFDLDRASGEVSPDLVFSGAYARHNDRYRESILLDGDDYMRGGSRNSKNYWSDHFGLEQHITFT